jgi:hypothetical protein
VALQTTGVAQPAPTTKNNRARERACTTGVLREQQQQTERPVRPAAPPWPTYCRNCNDQAYYTTSERMGLYYRSAPRNHNKWRDSPVVAPDRRLPHQSTAARERAHTVQRECSAKPTPTSEGTRLYYRSAPQTANVEGTCRNHRSAPQQQQPTGIPGVGDNSPVRHCACQLPRRSHGLCTQSIRLAGVAGSHTTS